MRTLVDGEAFKGVPYTLPAYPGPQCPGFVGDFVYLGPGLQISISSLQAKAQWYANLPVTSGRTEPPSSWLAGGDGSEVAPSTMHLSYSWSSILVWFVLLGIVVSFLHSCLQTPLLTGIASITS